MKTWRWVRVAGLVAAGAVVLIVGTAGCEGDSAQRNKEIHDAAAKAAGLAVAAYHFANPADSGGTLQADYAATTARYAPDGKTLLVLNAGSRTLSFIDPFALVERSRISVGDGPRSILVDRQGRRCYVFNVLSGTVQVIDIANRATVAALPTDPGPAWGQFNGKGDRLFVIHEQGAYLSVIDPFSLSIVQRVFVGPGLSFIKVDTNTDVLYASRTQETLLEAYDPFTLVAGAYIPAMSDVVYMTIDGQENNLYLASREKKMLMSINLVTRKITAETDVGGSPAWLTLMGER